MPAKKTKKTKPKKVMIMELPQPEKQTGNDGVIASLMSLQASQGWAVVLEILETNIKYLETAILERRDPLTQKEIDEKEVERLRDKRALTIELRDTPKNHIKKLQDPPENQDQNFDPYARNAKELLSMSNNGTRSLPTE